MHVMQVVKSWPSEWALEANKWGLQVLGGYGYMGDYVVERLWRDSKLLEIGGGTLESHQKNMAREMAQLPAMP